jgi:gas vesicle protein
MSSTWNDTLTSAWKILASANGGADRAVGTDHAVASARLTWWDGVKAVTGIVSMLGGFKPLAALRLVGLVRRRGSLGSLGLFGAGLALGVGAGMLMAPRSGARTRRMIMSRIGGLEDQAKSTLDHAASEVTAEATAVVEKVEDLAGKAKDAVMEVEQQAVSSAVAIKDVAVSKVEAATSTVRDAVTAAAKQSDNEATKPAAANGRGASSHRV